MKITLRPLRPLSLLLAICLALTSISCGSEADDQSETTVVPVPDEFVGLEREVVGELFTIWQSYGHLGSFDQAAERVGVELTDSLRQSLLRKMESNLMMHDRVAHYRPYTFTLTNDEKRISNYIRHYEQTNREFPALDSVAANVEMAPEEVQERLEFLSSLEMFFDLGGPDEYNDLGFSYGPKIGDFTYDLGTHIHVMKAGQSPELNIGCAKEALVIVANVYPDSLLTYHTYDPISLEPITVEFNSGEVTSTSPDGVVIFEGGPCGANNLFVSRANAEEYAAHQPQWQGKQLPLFSVAERLESVKQEIATGD